MLKKKKTLEIGRSDFKKIVGKGHYFVDKTLLIKEFIESNSYVLLMPRPRRFGKTLNLSMLEHFFDKTKPDSAKLFTDLKISEHKEFCKEHQNQYPVINLTLKNVKELNWRECHNNLKRTISELYKKHDYLLDSDKLKNYEKKEIENIILKSPDADYQFSLKILSEYLQTHHDKEVIILVDEYDTPIISGYKSTFIDKRDEIYYENIISFIQSFFGSAFKGNNALHKGLITGIMRVARESIFSDLNNLGTYTIFNFDFADKFGFTEQETKDIINYFLPNADFTTISKWYDGYKFGRIDKIFNPWSIVNYITKHEEGYGAYWVRSGADELITSKFAKQENKELREDLKKLIKGELIEKPIEHDFIFPNLQNSQNLLWSLLLYTGYLKPVIDTDAINQNTVSIRDTYLLTSPNNEIKQVYSNFVKYYFDQTINFENSNLIVMLKYLKSNNIEQFKKMFKQFVYKLSYHDFAGVHAENVYHAFVLGLLVYLLKDYQIHSNRESGEGRPDIILIPYDKTKKGIIFELKSTDKDANETVIKTKIKEAFTQITEKNYAQDIIEQNIKERIEIVMVFSGKKVEIEYQIVCK